MHTSKLNRSIWNQFTEEQQDTLRAYLHTRNSECPPHVIALKRFYWKLMKKRHRAFVDLKRYRNASFGEYAKERGIIGKQEDFKEFRKEGGPNG